MSKYTIEKDWTTAAGLRAVVIMGSLGYRCGYVGVPTTHPLFCVGYSLDTPAFEAASPEGMLDVHGGLTYAGGGGDYPVPSELWWFGYDCGHYGDAPAPGSPMERLTFSGVHRTLDFCIEQCESLAHQLKEIV